MLPDGKYRVLYADPPWQYEHRSPKWSPELHYAVAAPTSFSDFQDSNGRPVASLAAEDAVAFLWCPNTMLPDALDVLAGWGFAYKHAFVWEKRRGVPGPYCHVRTEVLLFAVLDDVRRRGRRRRTSSRTARASPPGGNTHGSPRPHAG